MKFINAILSIGLLLSLLMLPTSANTVKKIPKSKLYVDKDANDYVEIDFKNLKIIDLIKFSSKILKKNILLTQAISGNVDFISTKPVRKNELIDILINVLESRGYTLVGDGSTLHIIRSTDAVKSSLPILYKDDLTNSYKQMVTEFIDIEKENVDVVSAKIRHLASRYAKIVTNSNTNTLIITDYPRSIATLKKAIKIIARDKDKEVRLIPVENIRLSTVYNDLRKIINAIYTTTVVPDRIEVIQNSEINSLILIGKKKQLNKLEKYVKDVDKRAKIPKPDDIVEVIYLKNTESKNILATLNNLISKRASTKKSKSKPYISSDNESNSLVFIGPKEELSLLKDLIATLDVEKQQVYVRVQIIEISKKITDKVGIQYGLEGGALTGNGLLTFAMNLGGKAIQSNVIAGSLDKTVKQGAILGAGIDFLVQNSVAKVVSEPSITSINNKESLIQVGETRSILTGTSTTTTTTNNSYKREDIGLSLKVKPRISNDSKVTLAVTAKLEDVVEGTGGTSTPTTTKREVKTTAIVKHGESVIVGGLVKRKKTDASKGINTLSRIPILGTLFGNDTEAFDNVNLVIIMTPYIIPTSSDLSELRENLSELDAIRQEYLKNLKTRLKNFKEDIELEDINK